MDVLSKVGAVPGDKPFETFGKDSMLLRRRKHGTTGRLALPHQNQRMKLLRPSVQLPAGAHGWRLYKDFARLGKIAGQVFARGSGLSAPDRFVQLSLDLFVCISYN
jgi:hypothetical protein